MGWPRARAAVRMLRAARKRRTLEPCMTPSAAIGIDMGGTKLAAGLVDGSGAVLAERRRRTRVAPGIPARQSVRMVIEDLADMITELRPRRARRLRVGLASAGPMDVMAGILVRPPNLHGWKVVPVVALLRDELRRRGIEPAIRFQNDAVAAALGEGWTGAARGLRTYVVVTVGTGIGTGVILDGRPAQSRGMGSEWGHMLIDVGSGASVEDLASGSGLMRRAAARGLPLASVEEMAAAARSGSKPCSDLFADAARALAALFFNLSVGFHPERILVTGGLLAARDLFLRDAVARYRRLIGAGHPRFRANVRMAKLGGRAGIVGAARLALSGDGRPD